MNENIELLEHIYQTADMGAKSLTDLLKDIKDKDCKITTLVSEQLKGYEKYIKESEKLLKKYDTLPKGKGIMTEIMTKMGINKEVKKDNSDSAIAEMLIQGFNMGNLEMDKKIKTYEKSVDKKIINLAEDLLEFGRNNIKQAEEYL
ncbi:MAG: hypothetical protein HFH46_00785 [Bacilli bacterium]|nr:hypothetical protein [Bacilli bacterium]